MILGFIVFVGIGMILAGLAIVCFRDNDFGWATYFGFIGAVCIIVSFLFLSTVGMKKAWDVTCYQDQEIILKTLIEEDTNHNYFLVETGERVDLSSMECIWVEAGKWE